MSESEKPSQSKETQLHAEEYSKKMAFLAKHKKDPITLVLRGHLVVEHYLDRMILTELPRGDIFLKRKPFFQQKLNLVRSFDKLDPDIIDAITNLNAVRNNCSHDLEHNIDEKDLDKIGEPILDRYLKLKIKHSAFEDRLVHLLGEILVDLALECEFSMRRRIHK